MAAQKLTATFIRNHKPKSKNDEIVSDGNSLYIRFRKGINGDVSRTWLYGYKVGTRSVWMTLGEHEASLPEFEISIYGLDAGSKLTLETARKISVELNDWRKNKGRSPKEFLGSEIKRIEAEAKARLAEAERLEKQAKAEGLTLGDMFDAWLQDGVARKDGNAELRRSFKADVLPKIGDMPIRNLTEHDLRGVLRAMVARGANRAAIIMRNNLTQMFVWAEKRQPWRKLLIEGNPMELIEIEKIVSPDYDMKNHRNRVLSADEIFELQSIFARMQSDYETAPDKRHAPRPLESESQCAIWIMLATMCRVGETLMARWEHVDLDAGTWFIPKKNVKGAVGDHTVYLSDFALRHFSKLHELTGESEWCFPARNKDELHVCVKSLSKQIGDRQSRFKQSKEGGPRMPMTRRRHDDSLVLSGGKNGAWTPHDLRRTGATMMQSLRVSLETIDRCQNHVLAGSKVRRHYLHHDYAEETREAWRLLGERLNLILSGPANVVPLDRGKTAA